MLGHHLQGMFGVAGSLIQPSPEVRETVPVDPGVEALECGDTLDHQIWCEELGQRRRHRLDPGPGTGERDVGVDGEPYPGDEMTFVAPPLARQSHRLAQAQPCFDAALPARGAVVVEDAADPPSAYFPVGAVGEDRGILAGNVLLIVEAVGYPTLNLATAQTTVVHPDVEGVLVVVALRLGAQRCDEAVDFGRHRCPRPVPRGRPWPLPLRAPRRFAAPARLPAGSDWCC